MNSAVIVLAAGRGERLGGKTPKAFVDLGGKVLLVRALDRLLGFSGFKWIQPVISGEDLDRYAALELPRDPRLAEPVIGGAERQDSVAAGLAALPAEVDLVAIHDAARCRVEVADVARVVAAAEQHGAALLAAPVPDTVKQVKVNVVISTPDRRDFWGAQTPQVFHRALYAEALEKARADGFQGTDDAQLVERLGAPVHVVPGNPGNFKITGPEDLARAEHLLAREETSP
jgi:2-C-methyl-D-erythritol 4-phosphate cytidylyltransferase